MEDKYNLEFSIISYAGNAKAIADEAVNEAEKGNFDLAEDLILQAEESLTQAHQVQTDMIFNAVNGIQPEMSIFLVHAQDHLTMGTMAIENAKKFIVLYRHILNK